MIYLRGLGKWGMVYGFDFESKEEEILGLFEVKDFRKEGERSCGGGKMIVERVRIGGYMWVLRVVKLKGIKERVKLDWRNFWVFKKS